MAGYATRVGRDIDRWMAASLIDAGTAERLRRDVAEHARRSISFGAIIMIMAALLLSAAILLLVASNWEAIPRLVRVGLLFALIMFGYVGGAVLRARDHSAFGDALWLIAAVSFGGAIALIGQMYHLSGDEQAAILTWCGGTALAALALRSATLTVAAAAIASAWMVTQGIDFWGRSTVPHLFVPIAAVLWALSLWTRSLITRHLLLLSLLFYACLLAIDQDATVVGLVLGALSILLFAIAVGLPAIAEGVARLDGGLEAYALLGFLLGAAFVQLEGADDISLVVVSGVVVFGGVVAALVLAGRDGRAVRWIAYLGFLCELAFLYLNTLGTMLGSAGMFLASGVVLAVVAFIIIRVERRLNTAGEATQ